MSGPLLLQCTPLTQLDLLYLAAIRSWYVGTDTREAPCAGFIWLSLILLVVATLLFVLQNRDVVTMSFLGFSVRAPLAILIVAIYLIGAVTGGSLFALLRRSYRGSQRDPSL
jgi:uncharacterized integral membrane protein